MSTVILVDHDDIPVGYCEKLQAHQKGLCHRAFSVFILRRKAGKQEILLQQRQLDKYHSPGLWTNTCCSHPLPDEATEAAAKRRLKEEMGLKVPLEYIGKFHYIAEFENGLIENEVDHVFIGKYTRQEIKVDPSEVAATRWVEIEQLENEIETHPELFTAWLQPALRMLKAHFTT